MTFIRIFIQNILLLFQAVRQMMDYAGWTDGNLFCHIHEKWGLSYMTQIECLVKGANGIWASVCEEGAALGHACSTLTIMNLIRYVFLTIMHISNQNYWTSRFGNFVQNGFE